MALEIIFEDDDLVACVKPAGVVVHSTRDTGDDLLSLARKTLGHDVFAFHRLDKGTSGVLLLGKRRGAVAASITQAFEKKQVRKAYLAVVEGRWESRVSKVEAALEKTERGVIVSEKGKPSVTTFRVLSSNDEKSLIEALPKTGRTHQIRVHCAYAGHAVLGDALYGKSEGRSERLALHSYSLSFTHPRTGERMELRRVPNEWRDTWLSGLDVTKVWERLSK